MSQELNFFATGKDEEFVCSRLISVFDSLRVLPERGTLTEMRAQMVLSPGDLAVGKIGHYACLVPDMIPDECCLRGIPEGLYRTDFRACPVLEYSPCRMIAPSTLKVGRIAYFYHPDDPVAKKTTSLMTQLKRAAKKIPGKSNFWMFEEAAATVDYIQYWVGGPRPNPLKT